MREVVLDIETVPCEQAHWDGFVQRVPSLEKYSLDETALDWSFGRIVCIGMVISDKGAGTLEEVCLAGTDEAAILRDFWQAIRPSDYLIGHNLMGFDLPYILARSVICQVKPSRRFELRRFTTDHVYDTLNVWSQWGRSKFSKLETLAAIMGFDGKTGSGDQVAGWAAAGDWERIKSYCMDDVRLTRAIYQRMREYGM